MREASTEDSDSDEDDDESEDDTEDEEDDTEEDNENDEETIISETYTSSRGATVENIAKAFEEKGYTLSDALKLLLGRHSEEETKNTEDYYYEVSNCFDEIVETLDYEADQELSERTQMGKEDTV